MEEIFKKLVDLLKRNFFSRETIEESKKKWNNLALKNSKYFILSTKENQSEEEFRRAGEKDYKSLILDDLILKKEGLENFKRVLEIGCGTGRLTEFFARDFKKVYGIDISGEMIKQARQRLIRIDDIELFETNGLNFPLLDQSVDFIFSYIVFQHMPSYEIIEKNFQEAKRVLIPGGLFKVQLRGTKTSKGTWYYGVHYDLNGAKNLVQKVGFKLLHHQGENTKYFWLWLKK